MSSIFIFDSVFKHNSVRNVKNLELKNLLLKVCVIGNIRYFLSHFMRSSRKAVYVVKVVMFASNKVQFWGGCRGGVELGDGKRGGNGVGM